MTTKALKKQLAAAIAMVLVAGVALSSSTYAWFVSNNKVTATTTSISAMSNAPFLKINSAGSDIVASTTTVYAYTTPAEATELYPAQVIYTGDTEEWQSAYATLASKADEKDDTRFTVGTAGTHAEALENSYAFKQSFVIGTDADTNGSFENLRVDSITASASDGAKITPALRVLVVCGDNHFVYANGTSEWDVVAAYADGKEINNTEATDTMYVLADEIGANATSNKTVDVYLFYDGSQEAIYSNNLPNLGSVGVTVNFIADAFDPNGQGVEAGAQATE